MEDVEKIKEQKKKDLKEKIKDKGASFDSKINIEVITSPGCPHCPRAVDIAKSISEKYEEVEARKISIKTQEGREKAMKHGIMGTPTILVNDSVESVGVPDPNSFERKIESLIG